VPGGEGAQAGFHGQAGAADGLLEGGAGEGEGGGGGQGAEEGGGDDAAGALGGRLHVGGEEAVCGQFRGFEDGGAGGGAVAGLDLFRHRKGAVGGGDEGGAVGGDEAALDGTAGFHQFGGDDDIDVAGDGHEGEDGARLVDDFHVVDGGAGALGDAGDGGGLGGEAFVFGEVDDPVGEHAAALAAHGGDGDADGAVHVTASTRALRRACSQAMARARRAESVRSHQVGLWMMSAR
jgi:hypothetical protein